MAMNNPNKFVNSVSEELKGEFDDEARKNKAAQKITDRSDSSVFLGLSIGVVLGGILTGVIGFLLKWQVFTIFFAVIGRGGGWRVTGGDDCQTGKQWTQ
jgi:hypothetical protein